MIKLNAIPQDYEPRRKILPQLPQYVNPLGYREPEMNEFESAFLCGSLKKFRPKKILEVGVAGGATTAIILQALEDLGEQYEMHSIDVVANFYRDATKPSGFIAMFALEKIFSELRGTHKFYLGKILPEVIDEIGGDIDFVILDTVHIMPGESLDFIAMLPYLKDGAVVVLHDVTLNQLKIDKPYFIATSVLFSAVTAEKFLNFQPEDADESIFRYTNSSAAQPDDMVIFRYPNITAFQINEQTRQNIENIFLLLTLRWNYFPREKSLVTYRQHYRRFYPDELCEIFQEAIDMNAYNFRRAQLK